MAAAWLTRWCYHTTRRAKIKKTIKLRLRKPHQKQNDFINSKAKRIVIRAGRRGGKTTGLAQYAVLQMVVNRKRVLYAVPTADQIQTFWFEVKRALYDMIKAGTFVKNESDHTVTMPDTKQRIRAKTAWNADTLRGDYADVLILDEYQLMNSDAWEVVGAPMLLDNDGDACFIYTPPKPHDRAVGYKHAAELFKKAQDDTSGDWKVFHFSSKDNPHISAEALDRLTRDMTSDAYQREIMAEDTDEIPGALWTRRLLQDTRLKRLPETIDRVVIGVDPPGGATECGIVAAARSGKHTYIFSDKSLKASPERWAAAVIGLAESTKADVIVGEKNFGGDMVKSVIQQATPERFSTRYKNVHATRGKAVRAEPLVARFERGEAHIVGSLPQLEDEMCMWLPGASAYSPNRLDAMVWADTELQIDRPRIRVSR